ncbi:MAG: DUF167 family protein [Gammaproteobacteria bacterium]|nr:DUF167 family protein [Gammaproteobacteria bacterium]
MADSNIVHPPYRWSGKDLILSVVVQPRASNNALVGIQGAHIKVRLTAAPVDGKANELLIKQLAQWFRVPASRVSIEHGDTSKRKIVRIQQPERLPEFIEIP